MALITCKNCGKKISDTVEKCIHCGATTKEPEVKKEGTVQKAKKEDGSLFESAMPVYQELNQNEQIRLENGFIKSDKKARKYIRNAAEGMSYCLTSVLILVLVRLLPYLQKLATKKLFNGEVYNQKMLDLSEKFLVPLAFVWFISVVMAVYSSIKFRRRWNKQLYAKKFQKWLRDEKNIIYKPNFKSEKDRIVFEEINLDSVKK